MKIGDDAHTKLATESPASALPGEGSRGGMVFPGKGNSGLCLKEYARRFRNELNPAAIVFEREQCKRSSGYMLQQHGKGSYELRLVTSFVASVLAGSRNVFREKTANKGLILA